MTAGAPVDVIGDLPIVEVLAKCEDLERAVRREKLAVPDAIDARRPGGRENPGADALAWFDFCLWLTRVHAAGVRENRPLGAAARALDDVLADAATEKPHAVRCADGATRQVYPKSYNTLRFLDALDADFRVMHAQQRAARALVATGGPGDVEPHPAERSVLLLAPMLESLAVRLWAWILTHRGPGLPFREDRPLPDPPAWTAQLAPGDILGLLEAHLEVNARRLQIIAAAFPPDPAEGSTSSGLTLAGFLASAGAELEPGATLRLLRDTSLGQIFATRVAAAAAQRAALERARAERPGRER